MRCILSCPSNYAFREVNLRFELCTEELLYGFKVRVFWGIFSLRRTNALNRVECLHSEVVARSQCIKYCHF